MNAQALKIMLDTNVFAEIYRMHYEGALKAAVDSGKMQLSFAHIQRDEKSKIKDKTKRSCVMSMINTIQVQAIATAGDIVATDCATKHGFGGSRADESTVMSEEDASLLDSLEAANKKNL